MAAGGASMTRVTLNLDDDVIADAKRLADLTDRTIEDVLERLINRRKLEALDNSRQIGWLANEPEVMDEVERLALEAREPESLRHAGG